MPAGGPRSLKGEQQSVGGPTSRIYWEPKEAEQKGPKSDIYFNPETFPYFDEEAEPVSPAFRSSRPNELK